MSFIDEVKSYLQRARQSEMGPGSPPTVMLETSWIRTQLIHLFERLEKEDSGRAPVPLHSVFAQWTEGDRAIHYCNRLAALLQESFLNGAPREEVERYIRLGVAKRLGLKDRAPSISRQLELERLSDTAWYPSFTGPTFTAEDARSISTYVLEIRALRHVGDRLQITPIGNALLALTGRDAIQWLLNVEVAQSTGPKDAWRLSRETATYLLAHPEIAMPDDEWDAQEFPHAWPTIRRLEVLGVLKILSHEAYSGYELFTEGKRILEAVVIPNGSPFSVLASTLSQDEAIAALEDNHEKAFSEASLNSSAQATARQARLVAHEIRNALIPAQVALGSLYDALVGSGVETELGRYRPRIDPGINRVLKFVNDLLKTSELATRPLEAFSLFRALVDAKASITTSLDIAVSGSMDLPSVLGYRERFVLAVVNLLRNAEQAGAKNVELSVTLEEDGQNLLLLVEDDGPGVPAEHRERIFQRGVTLRKGGMGVGEGLALVKEVVEFELRGKIACVDKPGGGARFRMRLPVAERSLR